MDLILDRNHLLRFVKRHTIELRQVIDHLIGRGDFSKAVAGADGSQNIVEKVRIDLGLQQLVPQPLLHQRHFDNGIHTADNGVVHGQESIPETVKFIVLRGGLCVNQFISRLGGQLFPRSITVHGAGKTVEASGKRFGEDLCHQQDADKGQQENNEQRQ